MDFSGGTGSGIIGRVLLRAEKWRSDPHEEDGRFKDGTGDRTGWPSRKAPVFIGTYVSSAVAASSCR